MSRLSDAFDRLIASRPAGDPDDALAVARHRAATARTRQRALVGLGAAAAAVVLVVAVVIAAGDGPPDDVRTGPADSTTTSEPTTSTTTEVAPPTEPGEAQLFFSPADDGTCAQVTGVPRRVDADQPLAATIDALLDGPTPEEGDAGLTSWFSETTANRLRHVEVADSTAHVDFDDFSSIIPNASTSCGSTNLLAQLDATVTQFDGVDQAIYSFDGSPEAFYAWLQRDVPDGARPDLAYEGADAGYVTASGAGVVITFGTRGQRVVTDEPAELAYAVGTGFVAYQRRDPTSLGFPAGDAGPVMAWALPPADPSSPAVPFELPMGDGADVATLLDANWVDGRPTALVAEGDGTAGNDVRVSLVSIDLVTLERTLVAPLADGASPRDARLLANGDVIAMVDAGNRTDLVRWTSGERTPTWTTELRRDPPVGLASGGGRVSLIERLVNQRPDPDDLEVTIGASDIELATGELSSPEPFGFQPDDLPGGAFPRCHDWWTYDVLVCATVGGPVDGEPPFTVDPAGATQRIEAPANAMVTPLR
ncbi:MAG: GerMN domain-containing protein [Acidimicrobiales bacterium]|nr:GerMN domain-containing protein [Acidimicrobiales bacterium]